MRTWARGDGRCPSSLLASLWHSAAARLAPVLSPPTATLRGSTLNSASATDRKWHVAVSQSSSWAGYLCSGANRYLREVRGTTEDNMLDSGSLLDGRSLGISTCFMEKSCPTQQKPQWCPTLWRCADRLHQQNLFRISRTSQELK